MSDIISDIVKLKQERNAVILAHVYQPAEIQDIADFTGDSLELARRAAESDADVLVCCGVHFMAESAKILSPGKIVLLPAPEAGCAMADMVEPEALAKRKAEKPDALVVAYVNTTAKVKALSDICCTSANAVQVVSSLPEDKEIIFVPDQNLGAYVEAQTGRDLDLWPGYCPVHHELSVESLVETRNLHPDAKLLAHPECPAAILERADYVSSTMGIIQYVGKSDDREFIIATECGVMHQLQTRYPEKRFYLADASMLCETMKYTTLDKIKRSLETLTPCVEVEDAVREKAVASLTKMLEACR